MTAPQGTDWQCARCKTGDGGRIGFAPWPGELGARIQSSICVRCWDEWVGLQTKIINEYRLNVLDQGHARAVREQMEVFLGFRTAENESGSA